MDLPRKIGIAVVMIVPSFVGSGALWALFHSWIAVIVWLLLMAGLTGAVITGRFSKTDDFSEGTSMATKKQTKPEEAEPEVKPQKAALEEKIPVEKMPFCTSAPSAEQHRAHAEDEPCDDNRDG